MLVLVASFRKQRLSNPGLCDFIIRILELVLDACIVSFDGWLYHSQGGIPTGFSVASILANIYLWQFDQFIQEQRNEHTQLGS